MRPLKHILQINSTLYIPTQQPSCHGLWCLLTWPVPNQKPPIRNTGQNEQLSKRVGILKGTREEYEKQILATLTKELDAE